LAQAGLVTAVRTAAVIRFLREIVNITFLSLVNHSGTSARDPVLIIRKN
jgi:hypothetical protein